MAEPMVAEPADNVAPEAPPNARTDANRLVDVTAVAVTFAIVTFPKVVWPDTERKEPDRFVNCPFVPNRLVVVTEVAVALAKTAFQREGGRAEGGAASMDGSRLVETTPETARFVVVTFDPGRP